MRILERYITGPILKVISGCIALFCFLYIIIDLFNHFDEILKQKIALSLLIDYYLAYIPIILVQITPVACLLATLYVLGSLNRHNEIIAMRSSGISTFKIIRPIILLGILISIAVFAINEHLVPQSVESFERLKTDIFKPSKKQNTQEISNLCIYGLKNRLLFINKLSLSSNTLEGITILQEDKNQNILQKIVANRALWEDGNWNFFEIIIYNFDENGQIRGDIEYYPSKIIDIPETPQDLFRQKKNPQSMSIRQLRRYILRVLSSSAKSVARNLKVDLYNRLFFPFSSLVITILGIPFALRIKGRVSALSSFGVASGLGFFYYVTEAIFMAVGKSGLLPPLISIATPHLGFLCVGLYLLYRI